MAQPAAHSNGARPSRKPTKKSTPELRTLPHNVDAEASILGGIILHNDWLGRLETLETSDFYMLPHKVVFEAMRNLEAAGRPIDTVTLEDEITTRGKIDAVGGPGGVFFAELALRVPTVENVLEYARIVREAALVRDTILAASDQIERGYNWEYEADEFVGELVAKLQQLGTRHREANEKLPIITIGGALEEIDRLARTPVYETPFGELNSILGFGGLLGGQVYYLAGGTGFGKTSWISAVVKYHANRGQPALVAFYEMFAGYYVARMAAPIVGCHSNAIIRGEIAASVIQRALPPMIEFLDAPSMTTIRRAVERHVRSGRPPPLIVVDYIQLLGDQILATMIRPDARLANAQASAGLRALAKETGAAVIAVSAAGRSSSKKLVADVRKTSPRDLIDAARESGAIEYDGAGVIVLSVSDEKDFDDSNIATMTVAKARFGEAHHIDARYDGRTGNWREIGRVTRDFSTATTASSSTGKPKEPLRDVIAKLLSKGPVPSKTQLWKQTGRNKGATFSEIDSMIEQGIICETKRGIELAEITTAVQTEITTVTEGGE